MPTLSSRLGNQSTLDHWLHDDHLFERATLYKRMVHTNYGLHRLKVSRIWFECYLEPLDAAINLYFHRTNLPRQYNKGSQEQISVIFRKTVRPDYRSDVGSLHWSGIKLWESNLVPGYSHSHFISRTRIGGGDCGSGAEETQQGKKKGHKAGKSFRARGRTKILQVLNERGRSWSRLNKGWLRGTMAKNIVWWTQTEGGTQQNGVWSLRLAYQIPYSSGSQLGYQQKSWGCGNGC